MANAIETASDVFDQRMDEWRAFKATPWGRLRFMVVAHALGLTIERAGGGVWRILDVGGGDGGDALPLAAAGHSVTVLDPSASMLTQLERNAAEADVSARLTGVHGDIAAMPALGLKGFDLVLCHFVLQYLGDLNGPLAQLIAAARPGGYLSLIAPNRPGEVLAKAARGVDPAAAFALLDSDTNRTLTFDHDVRRIDAEDAGEALQRAGCQLVARFGVRCINDLLPDSAPKTDPAFFADLLRLELAVCEREPYLRTALAWQLVARKA